MRFVHLKCFLCFRVFHLTHHFVDVQMWDLRNIILTQNIINVPRIKNSRTSIKSLKTFFRVINLILALNSWDDFEMQFWIFLLNDFWFCALREMAVSWNMQKHVLNRFLHSIKCDKSCAVSCWCFYQGKFCFLISWV